GAGGVPAALLPRPLARARRRRPGQGPAARDPGVVLGRRGRRVPGVRALLDRRAQRLPPAADGPVSRRAGGPARAPRAATRAAAARSATAVRTVGSSGGMMTTDPARRLPIKTIFSGPAGGVSQACHVGAATGIRDFITYDMGGTSTDVCLVRDLAPVTASDGMVGAFPVKVPQLDMHSVGAGGGSVAWLDVDGSLQVGPRSSGATPGPAAYGLGGTEPTVTDANVVLGRIGTRRRLGGSIALDPA